MQQVDGHHHTVMETPYLKAIQQAYPGIQWEKEKIKREKEKE